MVPARRSFETDVSAKLLDSNFFCRIQSFLYPITRYRHFLYEGVGFNQLMDYYFMLRTASQNDDKTKNVVTIETFGVK